jgi:putative membrane protein
MSTTPSDLPVPPGRHRTHPFNVALGIAGIVSGALLGIVLEGIGVELLLSVLGLREIVSWWFRTYEVRPDELLVSEGILTRHSRVIPYRRVQQVDLRQGLVAQILQLVALHIETAGSDAGRVKLALLDRPTGERLRAFVLARRAELQDDSAQGAAGVTSGPAPATPGDRMRGGRLLYALDGGRLLCAGITSDLVVAVLAAVVPLLIVAIAMEVAVDAAPAAFVSTVLLIVLLPVAFVVLSALATALTYARYTLSVASDDVRIDHGLFQIEHHTVPRRRVQLISVSDNPLRRAFGLVAIHLHSAAPEGGRDATARLTIPLVARHDLQPLLTELMADASWQVPPLQRRSAVAARRAIRRRMLALAAPVALLAAAAFPIGLVAFVLVFVGIPWGRTAHARAGYGRTAELTAFAAGVLRHRIEIVPHRRVQSARATASWFQRRVSLATIALDVAGHGARPRLYDVDAAVAQELRTTIPRISAPAATANR